MPVILASLSFQTRSGFVCRGRGAGAHSPAGAALRAGRAQIRRRGFTLVEAYAGFHRIAGAPAGALAAWRAAERTAMAVWDRLAPPGCPRAPEIRLVLAVRRGG